MVICIEAQQMERFDGNVNFMDIETTGLFTSRSNFAFNYSINITKTEIQ